MSGKVDIYSSVYTQKLITHLRKKQYKAESTELEKIQYSVIS